MKIKKIKSCIEARKYAAVFGRSIGYEIPCSYFYDENVWGLYDENDHIEGGFALINKKLPRTLKQLESFETMREYRGKVTEFTGYFINEKKGSFRLTLRLAYEVLKNRRNLFIYSYEDDNEKLQKYYGVGNPTLVDVCYPRRLPGHKKDMPLERIELLTKWGIMKIFLMRTVKYIIKR